MSFLAPLYVAGVLAVALPVLFHLIRRTPSGRQPFSSLMFLTPSPPRITRRSRLNNILLLLLRAAALALLAFAFARPFLRQDAAADVTTTQGRRIAVLVDTSASMRRGDLWQQATRHVERVLDDVSPADEVGLFLFDRRARPAVTFGEWSETDPARRAATVRARLAEAAPAWDATHLADALATVADLLNDGGPGSQAPDATARQIVLISDLQQGSHVESLQGYEWPENVRLEVRPVVAKPAGNASLQLVKDVTADAEAEAAPADARLRVRVNNQPDSAREQLTLQWANATGAIAAAEPVKVYVPPGRSQVVRVPWPAPEHGADRLVLAGDEADFDNTLYVTPPRTDAVRVVFRGDDAPDDPAGLLYFLRSAAGDTPERKVELLARRSDEPLTEADVAGARLVVVATPLPDAPADVLRRFAEAGGDVLWVLRDAASARGMDRLTGDDAPRVEDATGSSYALISRVELDHPLFAPFADPRFGDFTSIHFWRHRRVTLDDAPAARVLATFDDGDPFLIERPVGQGRLLVMTSGWHPDDSQLALSTKFVPLVDGLLQRRDGTTVEAQYAVHDPIPLPTTQPSGGRAVALPDGGRTELPAAAATFDAADRPGVYRLLLGGAEVPLAVNVAADEGRTAPLAPEDLEQWGARLGADPASADDVVERRRQLQVVELENRQKLWRWLIVAVLGILVFETALAGHLAHRSREQQVTA